MPSYSLIFISGKCYVYEGKADTALQISEHGLQQVSDKGKMYDVYDQLWELKITCLTKLRKYDETFSECYKLLETATKYNDLAAQVFATNAIGTAYFNFLSDFANTKKWWMKAYQLMKGSPVFNDFPQVLTNLSYLYYGVDSTSFGIARNHIDSAQFFLDQAFVVAQQTENLKTLADCFTTQADIYNLQHKTTKAEQSLQQGVALYKQIGNAASIIDGLGSLADFYEDQKNYAQAITYQKQEEDYLSKTHSGQLTEFYRTFAANYEKLGNYQMADSLLHKFFRIQDSLYTKTKVDGLSGLEAKYELSNKEAAIAKQKLQLLRQNIWITVASSIVLLAALVAYLLYRRSKRRQVEALAVAEEKERKRIAADLHDNIGAYAAAICAGIDEIENRKLVSDNAAILHLKENATEIITSLRDTIWAFNKQSVTVTDISDRVKAYLQKLRPSYPLTSVMVEENIHHDKCLSPVQALHVFRIAQEALHNAFRHANCTTIVFTINSNNNSLHFCVEDNGAGFDPQLANHAGNGITNMRMRAQEAGFHISFGKLNPGTKVSWEIALRATK